MFSILLEITLYSQRFICEEDVQLLRSPSILLTQAIKILITNSLTLTRLLNWQIPLEEALFDEVF